MKNFYMVQTNIRYGNSTYLPYAAGTIAAYSLADPQISRSYTLGQIFCIRESTEKIVSEMYNPTVVAFSCYVWNFEFNKTLAKRIKQRFPECIIVFGGHNVPQNSTKLLESYDFIDVLIFGEGEQPFCEVLRSLDDGSPLSQVKGIAYRSATESVITPKSPISDLSDYPSPYEAGLFDKILEQYSDIDFSAILETNRGCPYCCAFCDWCEQKAKVRCFSLERIQADLKWMADKRIEFCYCSDANFGLLKRDEQIIDLLTQFNVRCGYPKKFRVNFAKHNNDTVFRITQKLEKYGLNKGATISFQSMTPNVLKNIGRENMPVERFSQLMNLYRDAGIATYSEIILGLPGETYDEFCKGIGELLKAGQHTSLFIYNCELIVNSYMAQPQFIEKYAIEYTKAPLYLRHDLPAREEIPEYSCCVIGTSAMNKSDWIKANMFSVLVQSCHGMGLLRLFALYLYYELGVKYDTFYKSLQIWAINNPCTVLGKVYSDTQSRFEKITQGCGSWSEVLPEYGDVSWPYEEAVYLRILLDKERFYTEISGFINEFHAFDEVIGDIVKLQRIVVKSPGQKKVKEVLQYDLIPFFDGEMKQQHIELKKRKNVFCAIDETITDNLKDFAKRFVWYGRKEQENLFL